MRQVLENRIILVRTKFIKGAFMLIVWPLKRFVNTSYRVMLKEEHIRSFLLASILAY